MRNIETTDPKELDKKYQEWRRYYFNKTNNSVVSDLFYAHTVDTLKCKACNTAKYSFSFFSALALEISESVLKNSYEEYPMQLVRTVSLNSQQFTADELIRKYFQPELIEGYTCNFCRKSAGVVKQQFLIHAPPILLVYFKRFNMMGDIPKKLNTKITINDFVFLELLGQQPGESGAYDLMAFIKHYGNINSGHYVASLRKDSHWVAVSDDRSAAEDLHKIATTGSSEVYLCAFANHTGL